MLFLERQPTQISRFPFFKQYDKCSGLIFCFLVFALLDSNPLKAQVSIHTNGDDFTGSGGSVSYSIGQITYLTHDGQSYSAAEGVQQAFEISLITALEEDLDPGISVLAYPNPVKNILHLEIETELINDFSFQLMDLNGKVLRHKKITDKLISISMEQYVPATYYLKVIHHKRAIKVFKIVKP
jgi:hypothetical protein